MPWPHVVVLDPYNAGMALARRMVRLGARVTVLEGQPIVSHSRGVESVIAPYEQEGTRWLEALREIASASPESVVLTGTDRGSAWLVEMAHRLPPGMHAFEHRQSAHLRLMNKQEANAIAHRAKVNVPWTSYLGPRDDMETILAEARWPCVIKPALSHKWRDRYGERRSFLMDNPEDARRLLDRPLSEGFEMLMSQYIPGGDEDVEEAILVRLADGTYPVRFGCRKLRQYPRGFGETAVGESSPLPETTEIAMRVLDEAGFVGVAGVECKRHAATGERWFLEVNVRLPGQWGLGDACGAQATPRLVQSLAGHRLGPPAPLRPGVRFVQPDLDWHSVRPTLEGVPARRRPLTLLQMVSPYLGAKEWGILDVRDPGPLVALGRLFIGRRLRKLRARLGRTAKP